MCVCAQEHTHTYVNTHMWGSPQPDVMTNVMDYTHEVGELKHK